MRKGVSSSEAAGVGCCPAGASSAEAVVLEGDALPLLLSPDVRGESAVYQSDCAEELKTTAQLMRIQTVEL